MKDDNVKFKPIFPEKVKVYKTGQGGIKLFAEVNEYEFNDLRIQIMRAYKDGEAHITPYFVRHNDQDFSINKHGRIMGDWKFFNTIENQLRQLLKFD